MNDYELTDSELEQVHGACCGGGVVGSIVETAGGIVGIPASVGLGLVGVPVIGTITGVATDTSTSTSLASLSLGSVGLKLL
jgi:hypothetical protein